MRKIDMLNQLQSEMKEARTTVEQLCNDWGWTLSNKAATVAPIVINKGQVVAVTDPRDQEEIDSLYVEIGRHIGRINQLAAENEQLIEENKQLKEQLAALKQTKEEQNNIIVKEADAVKQPKVTPAVETKDKVAEGHAKYGTRKPNPKKQPVIIDEVDSGYVNGQLSLDGKSYVHFTASNRFDMPVVYGVTDDEQLRAAKELLINQGHSDFFTGYASTVDELLYAEDKEDNIIAFCKQGVFYGFIDSYYCVWNKAYDAPTGCLIKNMGNKNRRLRKMDRSWGSAFEERARRFMALCETMKYVDINRLIKEEEMGVCSTSSSVTNEIVVDTKDVVNNTNDVVLMTEDEAADAL